MLKVVSGRPVTNEGRLEKEIRTYDLLDSLEIEYVRVDHEALMTMEACKGVDEVLGMDICKNLFLCNRQDTNFYLLLMPGDKPFKTKELSHQLGVTRLSFAKAEYMEQLLNLTPGSVSVMGLMNDVEHKVQLLIDEDIMKDDYMGCHPCTNTSSIKFKMKDLLEKVLPKVEHTPIYVKL